MSALIIIINSFVNFELLYSVLSPNIELGNQYCHFKWFTLQFKICTNLEARNKVRRGSGPGDEEAERISLFNHLQYQRIRTRVAWIIDTLINQSRRTLILITLLRAGKRGQRVILLNFFGYVSANIINLLNTVRRNIRLS